MPMARSIVASGGAAGWDSRSLPGCQRPRGVSVSSSTATPRILVSFATYNERDNLEPLIRETRAVVPAADVLVIDDNSPDGTGQLADKLAAADPRIHVLHRAGKL